MREIVAAMIGNTITNDPKDVLAGIKAQRISMFIDRKHMQFMAACDVGDQWRTLAQSKTLFYLDEEDNPYPALLTWKA